jgi:hypothetical protein
MALLLALTAGAPAIAHGVRHALFAHKAGRAKTAAFADKAGTATKATSATTATNATNAATATNAQHATDADTADSATNAGAVDGFSASSTAVPGQLLALGSNGTFPFSVIPQAPAEVYEGTHVLYLGGTLAGPVASVDGCASTTVVSTQTQVTQAGYSYYQKIAGNTRPVACRMEIGVNMSSAFFSWLSDWVADGTGAKENFVLVQLDGDGGSTPSVTLNDTLAFSLEFPALGPDETGWLTVEMQPHHIAPTTRPTDVVPAPIPLDGNTLTVSSPGAPAAEAVEGPATDGIRLHRDVVEQLGGGGTYNYLVGARQLVETLTVRMPAPSTALDQFQTWRGTVPDGTPTRHDIVVSAQAASGDAVSFEVVLNEAWPFRVDEYPRADGRGQRVLLTGDFATFGTP